MMAVAESRLMSDERQSSASCFPRPTPVALSIPDYELERCIGRGSYGEVWLARSLTGVWRAVKVIHRREEEQEKIFEREFKGIQSYEPISRSDDALMSVFHVGRNEGLLYYVMELADDSGSAPFRNGARTDKDGAGGVGTLQPPDAPDSVTFDPRQYAPRTLQNDLKRRGHLPLAESIELGLALTSALQALHSRNRLHRDVKPSNIIYVNGRPKLADIGLVAPADATLSIVGTPGYVAPEGPSSPRADIYSLGKVLYEATTGKDRQQYPEPLTALNREDDSGLWAEFNDVILRACHSDPNQRYESAEAMREDLAFLRAGRSVRRLRLMERRVKLAGITLLVLLVLAGVGYLVQESRLAAARERARAAEALNQEQRWQLSMQRMQAIRLGHPYNGWSRQAWDFALQAAKLRGGEDLRLSASGLLHGFDASVAAKLTNFSAVSAAFSHDGHSLLLGGRSPGPVIWDLETDVIRPVPGGGGTAIYSPRGAVQCADLYADSVVVFTTGAGPSLPRQDYLFSQPPQDTPCDSQDGSGHVVFSDDGTRLAALVGCRDGSVRVIAWNSGEAAPLFRRSMDATALALAPDGSLLAVSDTTGSTCVVRLPGGEEVARISRERVRIRALCFQKSPRWRGDDSDLRARWLLVAGDAGGTATVWDLAQQAPIANFRRSHFDISHLALSPDGTLLASGGRGNVRVWDMASERLLVQLDGHDHVSALTFSPDGRKLAVCTMSPFPEEVTIWNLENGRGLERLSGLSSQIAKLCLSPDQRWLAALSQNWEIAVWDLASGTLAGVIEASPGATTADNAAMAINPSGAQLAFSAGTNACLWDLRSKRRLVSWSLPDGFGDTMGFHSTGKLLLLRSEREPIPGERRGTSSNPYGHGILRIRDLLGVHPELPIAGVTNVAGRLLGSIAAPDASLFVVESTFLVSGNKVRCVRAMDSLSGADLWSAIVTNKPEYAMLSLDPTGRVLAYNTKDEGLDRETVLVEARTGRIQRTIPGHVHGVGPGGEWFARVSELQYSEQGYSLVDASAGAPFLSFKIKAEHLSVPPVIDRAGTLLGWANIDGTVVVAHLRQIEKRLSSLSPARFTNKQHDSIVQSD